MRRAVMLSLSVIIASFLGLAWQAHACLTDQGLLLVTDERLASVVGGLACCNRSRVEKQMSSVQLGDRNLKNSEFLPCFHNLILNKLLNIT